MRPLGIQWRVTAWPFTLYTTLHPAKPLLQRDRHAEGRVLQLEAVLFTPKFLVEVSASNSYLKSAK